MNNTTLTLQRKAYSQGFDAGKFGREIHEWDWEPEFRPYYLKGHADGFNQAPASRPTE
jgi:hypothetical protein